MELMMGDESGQQFEEFMQSDFALEEARLLKKSIDESADNVLYLSPEEIAYRAPHPMAGAMPGARPDMNYWVVKGDGGKPVAYACGEPRAAREGARDLLVLKRMITKYEMLNA